MNALPMTKTLHRAELACRTLRQAIIEQVLTPGTKLPEDQLGAQFGMSRTLVRATLARLQAEGLVETRPKRSATVAQPTLKEAQDVFDLRRALELEAVRLIAHKWRPEFGAELEEHLREQTSAHAAGDERVAIRLAGEFHVALAGLTGNALLQRYLAELVSRCSLILATFARPHSSECAISEHRAIIAALRRRDGSKAVALMDEHVGAVALRALIVAPEDPKRDLGSILSSYLATSDVTQEDAEPRKVKRVAKR
jgi:DNA-binding GntR family transcriptional regulator